MALIEKTVEFWFPDLQALIVDDTDTALTQITAYIPESSVTFKSVFVELVIADANIVGTSFTKRQISIQLGAAGYSVVTNVNTLTHSSENISIPYSADFTSYFVTNWTGTSMTMDCKLRFATASGGTNNPSVRVVMTYEYDDTSATQIKTVMIPLDAPQTTRLADTKPASAIDVIPILDTYLPESGKVYRQKIIVVQGNSDNTAGTAMQYIIELDTAGSVSSQLYMNNLQSADWHRWNLDVAFTESATHDFFVWCNTINFFSKTTAYLIVTYEFTNATATTLTAGVDASTTTIPVTSAAALGAAPFIIAIEDEEMHVTSISVNDLTVVRAFNGTTAVAHADALAVTPRIMNSMQLPMESLGSDGRLTEADSQRLHAHINIQEPGTIRLDRCMGVIFWQHINKVTNIRVQIGSEAFILLDQLGAVICGGNSCGIRSDSAFTLSRGDNNLTMNMYDTDTVDQCSDVNGFFFINYTSDQYTGGSGSHNRLITKGIVMHGTKAADRQLILAAASVPVSATDYMINTFCVEKKDSGHSTSSPLGFGIEVERASGEDGGLAWISYNERTQHGDPELGVRQDWCVNNNVFKMFRANSVLHIDPKRLDAGTARRWKFLIAGTGAGHLCAWAHLQMHNITYSVAGDITGFTGTVDLVLHRDRPEGAGGLIELSRSGDGAYSFNWFDNINKVKVTADDGTNTGTTIAKIAGS